MIEHSYVGIQVTKLDGTPSKGDFWLRELGKANWMYQAAI
jgi:hypothetical protein